MKKQEKWLIHCPECKTTFDVSEQMENWRQQFIREIEKVIEKLK